MDEQQATENALKAEIQVLKRQIAALEEEKAKISRGASSASMEEQVEMFRALAESSPDAVMRFSGDLRFLYVNTTVENLVVRPASEIVGRLPADLDLPRAVTETLEDAVRRVFGEKVPQRIEIRLPSGRWIGGRLVPEFAPDGRVKAAIISAQDMTEQKQTESQRLESQKLEAIGTLADGIAHEFNNILMGIQGYISLMQFQRGGAPTQDDKLQNIESLVEKGANLTKQLLGFAQSGMYEVCPTDLNALLDESLHMFGSTKREITIHRELEEDLPLVAADRGQLDQVFMNLYINAAQAMPAGGDLYVETRDVILGEDDTAPFGIQPGRFVEIVVRDTGVGMDERTRSRVFEPFFTTKEMGRGTGLGLAFVYGIVKNHGGIIKLSSQKGQGAAFRIYLPAANEDSPVEEAPAPGPARGAETILIVDDEEINIDVMDEWLRILGYKVLTAMNGKEAVAIYQEKGKEIDLVILDMIMPGMNGGEVFDAIKAINPEVKAILSSGYSIDGKAKEILQRGIKVFIQKPFRIDGLSQRIREVLAS